MSTGFFFRSSATRRPSPRLTPAAMGPLTLLGLMLAAMAQGGDFTYITNNGAIIITGYTGAIAEAVVPPEIDGLPVTGSLAQPLDFTYVTTNGAITVTGYTGARGDVVVPDKIFGLPVTSIDARAFLSATGLTSVAIFDSVASIGEAAFLGCTNLASITIGRGVTNVADSVFNRCINLTGVYFQGNAPAAGAHVFDEATSATVYFAPGTTGWGPTFGGRPTDGNSSDGVRDVVVGHSSANISAHQDAINKLEAKYRSYVVVAEDSVMMVCGWSRPLGHLDGWCTIWVEKALRR